jgi:transposase
MPRTCGRPAQRQGREKNGGQAAQALGRTRGGLTTKLHVICDGQGLLLGLHLTAGPCHEATQLAATFEQVPLPRRPRHLVADRGYDSRHVRAYLRLRRIQAVIPRKRLPDGRRNRRRGRPPAGAGGPTCTAQRGRTLLCLAQRPSALSHSLR